MKMKFDVKGTLKNLGILSEDQAGNLEMNLELEFAPEEFKDVLKYQLEVLPMIYNALKEINQVNQHEAEQASKISQLEKELEILKRKEERKNNTETPKKEKKEYVPYPYYGNGRPRP